MCSFYIFNECFPFFSGQKVGEGKSKGKESKPKPARRTTNVPCSVSSSRSESEHDVFCLYILLLCNRRWACLVLVWYQFIGSTLDNFSMNFLSV